MLVLPVKYLPYILLIAGIGGIATGEMTLGVICLIVGGIWTYLKHKGKE